MSACKYYRQQLALLSAGALNQSEAHDVLAHAELCSDCRAYSERLRLVVRLYEEDAARFLERAPQPLAMRSRPKPVLLSWRYAAALAVAACAAVIMIFFGRQNSQPPVVQSVVVSQTKAGSTLSIADSRAMLAKDLETFLQSSGSHKRPDYVFSVGSRNEEP